jgi:hypothetical protein
MPNRGNYDEKNGARSEGGVIKNRCNTGQFRIMDLNNEQHLCFGLSILKFAYSLWFTTWPLAQERTLADLSN